MAPAFEIFRAEAKSILTPTSGFIREAGFTHSLTPARNCTYGCTYCYVPTMGIYGGLRPDDWRRWGQFTTFKANAAALLARELRPHHVVYCSPLTDPYQPAEEHERLMPEILNAVAARPPRTFTIQTRGPLILRDVERLEALAARTDLRISFSLTTDDEQVRRWFEPHCAPLAERLDAMSALRRRGLRVFATLAPLLPCDPAALAAAALEVTEENIIGDPLHVRSVKRHGATTRDAAHRIGAVRGFERWFDPEFQRDVCERIRTIAANAGREFATGPKAFSWLANN